jgi:hypothetical protein
MKFLQIRPSRASIAGILLISCSNSDLDRNKAAEILRKDSNFQKPVVLIFRQGMHEVVATDDARRMLNAAAMLDEKPMPIDPLLALSGAPNTCVTLNQQGLTLLQSPDAIAVNRINPQQASTTPGPAPKPGTQQLTTATGGPTSKSAKPVGGHGQPNAIARGNICPQKIFKFTMGKREFTQVTGIKRISQSEATVDFTYKTVASDVGKRFAEVPKNETWRKWLSTENTGSVQMQLYDDGWRVGEFKVSEESFQRGF